MGSIQIKELHRLVTGQMNIISALILIGLGQRDECNRRYLCILSFFHLGRIFLFVRSVYSLPLLKEENE
jgi:hypothetical protein